MVFENHFLSWLSKRINARKNRLESYLHSYKNGITNLPRKQLPSDVPKAICSSWLDPNNSIVSTDSRSDREIIRVSKLSYLLKYKHFEGINDNNKILQRKKRVLPKLATRKPTSLQIVKFTLN